MIYLESSNRIMRLHNLPFVHFVTITWISSKSTEHISTTTEPILDSLQFSRVSIASNDLVDRNFPHLEHFSVVFASNENLTESQIELMLRKNPKIKSIFVGKCSVSFIGVLDENLPNLEILELDELPFSFFADVNRVFRFENVKRFTLNLLFHVISTAVNIPFAFGNQLEEMELVWPCSMKKLGKQWFQLIESYSNIKKLNFRFRGKACAEYAYLAKVNLPNLRELKIRGINLNERKEMETFLNKIQQWTTLERLNLLDIQLNQTDVLRNNLSSEWTMTVFENQYSDDLANVVIAKT